jgi:nucleotide-binding universal stress UspA family protein
MNTIIVPTDFSKNANNALTFAIEIAKRNDSKIVVLHTNHYDIAPSSIPPELELQQFRQLQIVTKEKLEAIQKEVVSKGVECKSALEIGPLSDVLDEIATRKKAKLIVMGTQGASGLKETFLGSNTGNAINHTKTPILAIPENCSFNDFEKVVFTTNYERRSAMDFKHLVQMIELFRSNIKILHIANGTLSYSEEEKLLTTFENEMKEKYPSVNISSQLMYGEETENIMTDFIKREHVNLVCFTTKHRSLLERIFGKPSITKKMIYHSSVPILAFPH